MRIRDAADVVITGGPRGEADEVFAAGGDDAAQELVRRLEGSDILAQAMSDAGSVNIRRFERIIAALATTRSATARAQLSRLTGSQRENVRAFAARTIVAQGDAEAVKFLRRVIEKGGGTIFTQAFEGLLAALKATHVDAADRAKVFEAVVGFVEGTSPVPDGCGLPFMVHWPDVLLALDESRAREVLASARCLRVGNPELADVFSAIDKRALPIDLAALRNLLDALANDPAQHRRALASGCKLMAHRGGPCADLVEPLLETGDLDDRLAAVDILFATRGWERLEYRASRKSTPLNQVAAVYDMLGEMSGDGVVHWAAYDEPRKWKDAIEGLKLLDAARSLAAMQRAFVAADADKPEERRSNPDDEVLDAAEDELFKDEHNVSKRIWQFMRQLDRGGLDQV